MRWIEASLLEQIVSENSKFYPLKLDLRNSGLVLVLVSRFSSFLVPVKIGFDFSENLATEKVRSCCQKMR
jgi:hypothetical protein